MPAKAGTQGQPPPHPRPWAPAFAGATPGHTHAKSAFIYATVLEGAIRSKVNDGPVTTYKAGQSWSELTGDRHAVSVNASETKPAKLLAVFVVDTNETELTIPFGN
jgi:quercetin dioxygenase-like cupin family protein